MKKEYDFSKGVRGKFYNKNAKPHIPVYLNRDNFDFISQIAEKRKTDLSSVVNELIKQDKQIVIAAQ